MKKAAYYARVSTGRQEKEETIESQNEQEFYFLRKLADALWVSHMTIYHYIKAGKIKVYKIGKELRISKKEFRDFLNRVVTKQYATRPNNQN